MGHHYLPPPLPGGPPQGELGDRIDDLFTGFIHVQNGTDPQSRQPPGMDIDLSILHLGHRAGPLQEIQITEHSIDNPC